MTNLDKKPKNFILENNTAKRVVKADVADKIEVEIGDSKQADFKPQFKVSRWDNEVNFSMRAEEDADATTVVEDDIIKYKAKDFEVHQYEKPEVSEDGGFEFEWVLPKKPTNNVLTSTVQSKDLDFFYQAPLTQDKIDRGDERPENIVGSYAVYHKTKKNNYTEGKSYRAGKAFHIYRPEAIDADGNKTWCDLNITDTELTVTVPQDYLDSAKYPVTVDPTFGYTTLGASSGSIENLRRGNGGYGAGAPATIDSLHAAVRTSSGSTTPDMRMMLNDENTVTDSHDEVVGVERTAVSITTTAAWETFTASDEVIDSGDYVINIMASVVASQPQFMFDDSTSINTYFESGVYATLSVEDPWTETDASLTEHFSLYATYTASGSESSSPSPSVSSSPSPSVSSSPSPSPSSSVSSSSSSSPSPSPSESSSPSPSSSSSPSPSASSSISSSPSSSSSSSPSPSPSTSVSASPSSSESSSPSASSSPSSSVSASSSSSPSSSPSPSESASVSSSPSPSVSSSPSSGSSVSSSPSPSESSSPSPSVSSSPSPSVSSSPSESSSPSPSISSSPSPSESASESASVSSSVSLSPSSSPSPSASSSISGSPSPSPSSSPSPSASSSISGSPSPSVSSSPSSSVSSSPSPSPSVSSSPSASPSPQIWIPANYS